MSARSRAASVEPLMDRPDFRSKLVRDLIPEPPDYLSAHQKRQWRQQKWTELFGQQAELQVGAPVVTTPPQPKAKARAAAYFGGGGPEEFDLPSIVEYAPGFGGAVEGLWLLWWQFYCWLSMEEQRGL